MPNSKRPSAAIIRHKEFGTVFRIIRTYMAGDNLYWIVKGIDSDGVEDKGTSHISVDSWSAGLWETVQ